QLQPRRDQVWGAQLPVDVLKFLHLKYTHTHARTHAHTHTHTRTHTHTHTPAPTPPHTPPHTRTHTHTHTHPPTHTHTHTHTPGIDSEACLTHQQQHTLENIIIFVWDSKTQVCNFPKCQLGRHLKWGCQFDTKVNRDCVCVCVCVCVCGVWVWGVCVVV